MSCFVSPEHSAICSYEVLTLDHRYGNCLHVFKQIYLTTLDARKVTPYNFCFSINSNFCDIF